VAGGSSTQRGFTRPIAQGALDVAQKKLAAELRVFVAGPYVNRSWDSDQRAQASAGALLRLEILTILARLEHKFILGEHRGVAEVTADNIPSQASIALSELQLVDTVDAIIIVPDSPGSFAELGAWTIRDDLCPKTLVLANADYKDKISFIRDGVFPMARHLSARVEWLDYTDHSAAEDLISGFLSEIQDRLVSRIIRRGK
jgi:hypothetical protein